MVNVGFSTGVFYNTNMKLVDRLRLFNSKGADCVELGLGTNNELMEFNLNLEMYHELQMFKSVSIHAPWDINYEFNSQTIESLTRLKNINNRFNVTGFVFHPNKFIRYELLEEMNIPILIENMNSRNEFKTTPEYFDIMKSNYRFGFVLDLEHVYENDSSMKLAYELIEVMGNRLKHLHVSGSKFNITHHPLYDSDNKEMIQEVLKDPRLIQYPRISEGIISENLEFNVKKELAYLRT